MRELPSAFSPMARMRCIALLASEDNEAFAHTFAARFKRATCFDERVSPLGQTKSSLAIR